MLALWPGRRGEGRRQDDILLERARHGGDARQLVHRRPDHREIKAIDAADVAIEHLADVEAYIASGGGKPLGGALLVDSLDPPHGLYGAVEGARTGLLRIIEREGGEHAVTDELQDLAAMI